MAEFIYDNVIYILAPVILSVSVTEFVLLLKSLFCTQPVRTDYLLKWTVITFFLVLTVAIFWRSVNFESHFEQVQSLQIISRKVILLGD